MLVVCDLWKMWREYASDLLPMGMYILNYHLLFRVSVLL